MSKEGKADKKKPTSTEGSSTKVSMDLRCADCTKAFVDLQSLLQHCQSTGHSPLYASLKEAGESSRGSDSVPIDSNREVFLSFCNVALRRAMGERMALWGRDYIDPKSYEEPKDRGGRSLGVKLFRAFRCEFGLHKRLGVQPGEPSLSLTLTVDLRAKLLRTRSLLQTLCGEGKDPKTYSIPDKDRARLLREWKSEVVIATYDKKCYSVTDLIFDKSPASMPVEGLGMSHAEYFKKRKNITLDYPNCPPMVEVLGRNNSRIYLPAEVVCGNELEPKIKMQLPSIASFKPPERNEAIEEMKRYLTPGGQKTKGVGGGLLPAIGIVLGENRLKLPVDVLHLPVIIAGGLKIPESSGAMWAPQMSKAKFDIQPGKAVAMNVIIFHNDRNIQGGVAASVYNRIRDLVNNFNGTYCFPQQPYQVVAAGENERHWGAVETTFGSVSAKLPPNVFVLDFVKSRGGATDHSYPVVKQLLGQGGHLSQFVNFNTYDHGNPSDDRKSNTILQGVARQILSKCGMRVWWVNLPPTLPLPAVFVGVDVFHAPRRYDPRQKKKLAKESVAAIIVQVIKNNDARTSRSVDIYCETTRREAGQEMALGKAIYSAVSNAVKYMGINPMSCIVWRDGVGDSAISQVAQEELPEVRRALESTGVVGDTKPPGSSGGGGGKGKKKKGKSGTGGSGAATSSTTVTAPSGGTPKIPVNYIVCQKRIATKFLSTDGRSVMPSGALVQNLQGPDHATFYINGRAPPYSTPKPVRFVIVNRDTGLSKVSMVDLTWALCHDYPNWTGPVKLPSPVQMAHKLAELAGGFADCGDTLNSKAYLNKIYFL